MSVPLTRNSFVKRYGFLVGERAGYMVALEDRSPSGYVYHVDDDLYDAVPRSLDATIAAANDTINWREYNDSRA